MLDWKQINGAWYCYKNGTMVKGWIQDTDKRWYYLNASDDKMVTGWVQVDSKWYYLYTKQTDKDNVTHYGGEMATGWIQIDSKWYYLYTKQTDKDNVTHYGGEMATGWIQLNSKWYYLLTQKTEYNGNTHYTGEMVASTTMTINNKSYTFDSNGVMQEGSSGLYSEALIGFIKGWESFHSHAYEDPYHPGEQSAWTIGYGTTYQVNSSAFPNGLASTCTVYQADQWVRDESTKVANEVKSVLDQKGASISQQAFDCLCDIGYNAGTADLLYGKCVTLNAVISGDADSITNAIMSWCHASGGTSSGLYKRCQGRVNMCLNGIYDSTH